MRTCIIYPTLGTKADDPPRANKQQELGVSSVLMSVCVLQLADGSVEIRASSGTDGGVGVRVAGFAFLTRGTSGN